MRRDEDSFEEQAEEFTDTSSGESRTSSASEDEGSVSDNDEEILEQATEEQPSRDVEEGSNQSASDDTRRLSKIEAIASSDRSEITQRSPQLNSLDSGSVAPIRLTGTAPTIQRPELRTPNPSLRRETSTTGIQLITLDESVQRNREPEIDTLEEVNLNRMSPELTETIGVGSALLELEDPFYTWAGGTPYGSGRPAVILHISPENNRGVSLSFLERRLRDEYTQRNGGEPQAKGVRLVANKPKIPDLSNAIVTYDLTDDEWELEADGRPIRVVRNGEDALEYIAETVRTTYAGGLGYLVVNVPARWRDPISPGDVIERIRQRLLGKPDDPFETLSEETADEDSQLVARCEPDDVELIRTHAGQYWFGTQAETKKDPDQQRGLTVQEYEEQFERKLRDLDWLGTVLTEKGDNESEEHYHLKSKLTAGLANEMYEDDSGDEFESFVVESLLDREGPIQTEYGDGPIIDIRVNWQRAIDDFVPNPEAYPSTVAFEIETGRGEAGASFRKVWHTIERLERTDVDVVYVVVPPRLLLQRRSQSAHLQKLIAVWNKRVDRADVDGPQAFLCVPTFDSAGNCTAIRDAEMVTKDVFST